MKKKSIMKKIIAVASAAAMLTVSNLAVFAQSYSDVSTTHWAYNAVERCAATMWFEGYPDGTFRPDGKITRAEALKVFVTYMGLPLSTVTSSSYYDVSATAWYAPYVEAGKELFPTRTALDGQKKFQPDMPVTREDTIYALVKALRYDSKTEFADLSVLNMFSDQNSITSSVKPYVAVAVSNGLAAGYDDGTIGAQDPLTRAEFATLLYRASYIAVDDSGDTAKVISKIAVEPEVMQELKIGESFEITASVAYTDGSAESYTNSLNPYTDSAEGIVVINKNKITAVGEGTAIIKFNNDNLSDKQLVVIVAKPTDAPAIVLDTIDASTEATSVTVSGKITDATGTALTLTVNGVDATVNSDGSFSAVVNLEEGTNTIKVSAKNAYGNEGTASASIERVVPLPEPAATADEPEDELTSDPVDTATAVTSVVVDVVDTEAE